MKKKAKNANEIIEMWLERDLTQAAAQGSLPEAFCVQRVCEQLAEILAARRHPIIIGESGVGKTAVVYELVRSSTETELGHQLLDKRIVQISLRRFASTLKKPFEQMRPEMQQLVSALIERKGAVVPFFRDVHLAYDYDLEPHLQLLAFQMGGPILCEGHSTRVRQLLESSPDLEQHYFALRIEEPSLAETMDILTKWAEGERRRTSVVYHPSALEEALYLTNRFLSRDRLPRKAIDLLHQASASMGAERTVDAVCTIERFSAQHSIPRFLVDPAVALDLAETEEKFRTRILGQEESISAVVKMIGMIKAGLSDMRRPFGAFLFVGPTGVGKTHLAQYLAEYLTGSKDRLIRINMADFPNDKDSGTLFGDPDSHNLQGQRGLLTQRVSGSSFSVLLLDEFEKAHNKVHDRFLQLIDEGEFINGASETISCRSIVVIATSNAGAQVYRGRALGFRANKADLKSLDREVDRHLEKRFRFEFLNRFDHIVHFHPLSREHIRQIALRELEQLQRRPGLKQRKIKLDVDESILDWLTVHGYDPDNGARFLRRVIERNVTTTIADAIVRQGATQEGTLSLTVRSNRIRARFLTQEDRPHKNRQPVVIQEGTTEKKVNLTIEALQAQINDLLTSCLPMSNALGEQRRESQALLVQINDSAFWNRPDRNEVLEKYRSLDVAVRQQTRWAHPLMELKDLVAQGKACTDFGLLRRRYERAARAYQEWHQSLAEEGVSSVWMLLSSADPLQPAPNLVADLAKMEIAWCRKLGLEASTVAYGTYDGQLCRAVIEVDGPGASVHLSMEQGVHRRRRPMGPDEKVRIEIIEKSEIRDQRFEVQSVRRRTGMLGLAIRTKGKVQIEDRGIGFELLAEDNTALTEVLHDLDKYLTQSSEPDPSVARIYGENGTVRDPRTAAVTSRVKDVWKGRLDRFLEAWRQYSMSV